MFEISISVPESDVSPGYNHVNHYVALSYLEYARLEYLKSIGFPNEKFLEQGLFLVISRIDVKYKREIFREEIRITCEDVSIDGKTIVMNQRMINSKGKTQIEARVESMFMNGATKRSIEPPELFARAINLS